jgi:hypothetical protein
MNPDTRIVSFCYDGDKNQVEMLLPHYLAHGCPVTIMSPDDSRAIIPGVDCRFAGRRAYIGQASIDRHRAHLKICLEYPEKYFLLNDSDSFCLSPELPARLYRDAENTVWCGVIEESRPHASPYPKIAMHPPYFLTRETIQRLLDASDVKAHPITPYLDWYWVALVSHAHITFRSYSLLEHPSIAPPFEGVHGWDTIAYRIRHTGTVMMHPIKNQPQLDIVLNAYQSRQ